jgi:DNA polymerase I-like protein with 3'-5' exonuclease and polymerase domains
MLVQNRDQFDSAIDTLNMAKRVAFDTESNGLHTYKGHRLCGVAAYVELAPPYAIGIYFPFRHERGTNLFNDSDNLPIEWLQEIGGVLERPDLTTIWHGFKFDAKMLRADGIEIGGTIYDTQVMATLVDENAKHSLGAVEATYLGTTTKGDTEAQHLKPYLKGKKDYSKVPPKDMEYYACNDTRLTQLVWYPLVEALKEQELWHLWPDHADFLRQLFEMEWAGIPVDQVLAAELSGRTEARMRELEDALGFDPQKLAVLADRLFAPEPTGLGLPIPRRVTKHTSPLFPQGLPGQDNEELLGLINHHESADDPTADPAIVRANEVVSNVLEYRGLVKANSTWYRGFQEHSDNDGTIHPTYNTAGDRDKYGTVTSRLTCALPNIQQLPRDPRRAVYKLLIPDWRMMDFGGLLKRVTRHRLYVADYSQIEYRLGSVYADETEVLEMYMTGGDVHQVIANKLGIPRNDPAGKVDGKKANFTLYYGAAGETAARLLKIPKEQGELIHQEYWQALPNTRKFIWQCTRVAKQRGYIKLWNGRRRHLVNQWEFHKAFNSLIQGGAAQIMERSMVEFYRRKAPYRIAFQVHDALGIMVPDDFREHWLEEIREVMEWPSQEFPIPFPVEFKNIHPEQEVHVCTEDCLSDMPLSTPEPTLATLST